MSLREQKTGLFFTFLCLLPTADADVINSMGVVKTPVADYETIPMFALGGLNRDIENEFAFSPLPIPGHQGDVLSCTGWAIAHAAKTISHSQNIKLTQLKESDYFSAAFLYNQSRPANCSSGVELSAALYVFEVIGVVKAIDFPHTTDVCAQSPSPQLLQKARNHVVTATGKVTESWGVTDEELVEVKTLLFNGYPIIVSMETFSDFHQWYGKDALEIYTKESDADYKGAHAMTVVGYDDTRQGVLLINSWGTSWGSDGFAWVSYKTFKELTLEAYVFLDE